MSLPRASCPWGRVCGRPHYPGQLNRMVNLERHLLDFTSRCFFLQVCYGEHRHRYYSGYRNLSQVEGLYDEIKEEVSALKGYVDSLDRRESEHRAWLVQIALVVVTAFFLPAGALLALFATKLGEWPGIHDISPAESAWITIGILIGAVGLVAAIHLLLHRSSRWRRD